MSPSTIHSTQKVYKIALIPGDGIGVDITNAATKVLTKLAEINGTFHFEFNTFDWSSKTYLEKGYYIPPDGIAQLKKFDAIFFGAVGWPGMYSTPSSFE
jgi:isocitrate/isopropylmalate dehydrogenase